MKKTISPKWFDVLFWVFSHGVIATIVFSFFKVEDPLIPGSIFGTLSYLLIQYYKKKVNKRSIFNIFKHGSL